MKKIYALTACCIIGLVLLQYRALDIKGQDLKVTTWDALGYYLYLPSALIYDDITQLEWIPAIESKYGILQGANYPATKETNGNYVMKYLAGVAIMESPFFLAGRVAARKLGYADDGFSPPFQYAVALAALFYCILGVFLLCRVLLWYFSDRVTAVTLLLLCLASNLIQYASVDSGMSHAYIFFLYAAILYVTIKWHRQPKIIWAALIGFVTGFATISRPTEAIMCLIPIFWSTHTKEAAREKWELVKKHRWHVFACIIFGIIGILPQLIYWKIATGSFIYDVGSAWDFVTPHLRVLFGWEKGWFIYTPVTVFFIAGLFFTKKFPFRKSVLWFCLLNIYIIISWREWHYAASYSTRALVQSYPVFALPLAAFIDKVNATKWRWLFYAAAVYLLGVNLFQERQYMTGVLHYDDMNRKYYGRIYLNAHPSPLDMSLLDTDEMLCDDDKYQKVAEIRVAQMPLPNIPGADQVVLLDTMLADGNKEIKEKWLKIESDIKTEHGTWQGSLNTELRQGDSIKHNRIRLFNAISPEGKLNRYMFYVKVPGYFYNSRLKVYLSGPDLKVAQAGAIITVFEK